jgi:hypothetical protein
VFEDPYEDEYESDGEVVDAAAAEAGDEDGAEMDELEEQLRVWRPGIDKLAEDEVPAQAQLAACPARLHGMPGCRIPGPPLRHQLPAQLTVAGDAGARL